MAERLATMAWAGRRTLPSLHVTVLAMDGLLARSSLAISTVTKSNG